MRPPPRGDKRLTKLLERIPALLVTLRVVLAGVVILMAWQHRQGFPMATVIVIALLSDIYDGNIARRFGVENAALRRADSAADTIFYAAAAYAAWILVPNVVRGVKFILALLISFEALRYCFDYLKFRREASYHSYSAKLWGLVLATALTLLLAFNVSGWILRSAIWIGIVSDMEGLAISMVLPIWRHDVHSIFHALRLRTQLSSI
ncbi:MAG TPA: CDP-alcohol phosphatidyltransferase family protein [Terriglobales bacterium]|nr:CDP-alcohol phosphatidyltransferase family protein [Terriglobales bacterium]